MRDVSYTDSELWVKDGLDRLFWLEIAKRKARLAESKALRLLIALRQQLEAFFESKSPELEEPLDYGADIIFDTIQFQQSLVETAIHIPNEHDELKVLQLAMTRFEKRVLRVGRRLTYAQGFRWADFSVETDLVLLHKWWTELNSSTLREELGITEGKFSTIGGPRLLPDASYPGELIETISTYTCPVRIPKPVPGRPVFAYTTNEHDIRIDGSELKEKLVLEIDLTKSLPSMREIEKAIVFAYEHVQTVRILELFHSGIVPDELISPERSLSMKDYTRLLTRPPGEHQLFKAQNSVEPLIRGLFCWDLIHIERVSKTEAYNQTAKVLGECPTKSVFFALKNVIQPEIEKYQPSRLPWA